MYAWTQAVLPLDSTPSASGAAGAAATLTGVSNEPRDMVCEYKGRWRSCGLLEALALLAGPNTHSQLQSVRQENTHEAEQQQHHGRRRNHRFRNRGQPTFEGGHEVAATCCLSRLRDRAVARTSCKLLPLSVPVGVDAAAQVERALLSLKFPENSLPSVGPNQKTTLSPKTLPWAAVTFGLRDHFQKVTSFLSRQHSAPLRF